MPVTSGQPFRQAPLACTNARPASLNALAQRLFGFSALHDFQHTIIRRVLQGRNTLGLAATAAGKTECFLLPALLLPGLTVVVSPLKSLMQDQWGALPGALRPGALTTFVNGDVDHGERQRRLRRMREGRYKLAYFTPEQLAQHHIRAALQRTTVSVLAIDEAHCVSQWGRDFRPDYLNMVRRLRECWPRPPVIVALTATASERVRRDLCDPSLFNLDNRPVEEGGDIVFHGSNRLELDLVVRVEPDAAARSRRIALDLEPFTRSAVAGSALVFLPYTGATGTGDEEGESSAAVEPFAAWLERQLGQQREHLSRPDGAGGPDRGGHVRWHPLAAAKTTTGECTFSRDQRGFSAEWATSASPRPALVTRWSATGRNLRNTAGSSCSRSVSAESHAGLQVSR